MDEKYRQRPTIGGFASISEATHPEASIEAFNAFLLVDPSNSLFGSLIFGLHPGFEGLERLLNGQPGDRPDDSKGRNANDCITIG
jgi:hypothetical protein